jgi:hypothetical protein
LAAIENAEPRDEIFMPPAENHSWLIFKIAGDVLGARIAKLARQNQSEIECMQCVSVHR